MDTFDSVKEEAVKAVEEAKDLSGLQEARITWLGKKGKIQGLMAEMKNLPKEEKPAFGQKVNGLKKTVSELIEERQKVLQAEALKQRLQSEKIDITLDGEKMERGTIHPLIMIQQELEDLFIGMGYKVAEGPEVEQDYYNFELANLPKDHPARDMQDTFYIDPSTLLRTHTTAIQMRELEKAHGQLPIKLICPGKVYRRDDDDSGRSQGHTGIHGQCHVR